MKRPTVLVLGAVEQPVGEPYRADNLQRQLHEGVDPIALDDLEGFLVAPVRIFPIGFFQAISALRKKYFDGRARELKLQTRRSQDRGRSVRESGSVGWSSALPLDDKVVESSVSRAS